MWWYLAAVYFVVLAAVQLWRAAARPIPRFPPPDETAPPERVP